jgi:hypothetical protein
MRLEDDKLRQLTIAVFIAILAFGLGIVMAFWWIRHDSNLKSFLVQTSDAPKATSQTTAETPPGWQKIDMNGAVTFYIPPGLRPVIKDTPHLYSAFRNDSMEIFASYDLRSKIATCIVQNDKRVVPRTELTKTTVGGQVAFLENIEKITFDMYQTEPVLKGVAICVHDVGDSKHQFAVVGMYKGDQDYQTLRRIIDSIKFSKAPH